MLWHMIVVEGRLRAMAKISFTVLSVNIHWELVLRLGGGEHSGTC
jgi:hypothetical protein